MSSLTHRVDFGFIRYANCWEDADILLEALQVKPGDRVLSVASAGDNSFSLLSRDPELVVAVDVNRVQLHLCELKKAAFTLPEHRQFLELLGFAESARRTQLFEAVSNRLSENARAYWKQNSSLIEAGVVSQGKFERYFATFRSRLLPLIHGKKRVTQLFAAKNEGAQQKFYLEEWNTWRWRMFFRIFFSKYVMGKYGRDPEFLKEVKVPVSEYIFTKAEKHLCSPGAQQNFFLHHIMLGTFSPQLPHYARKENFEAIRKNIDRMELREGYAEMLLEDYPGITAMNLSNIFEYMNPEQFRLTGSALIARSAPGARFAYWNLMVPRRLSGIDERLVYEKEISQALSAKDKGFFYNQFILDRKA